MEPRGNSVLLKDCISFHDVSKSKGQMWGEGEGG